MTCIRCQIIEAAEASGNERPVIEELSRQIEELQDDRLVRALKACMDADHERTVARLNEVIAERNAEIVKLKKGTR